jgi:hypothetical protein
MVFKEMNMNFKPNRGHISSRQRAVIDDMLKNGLTEKEALEKHGITPIRYRRWLKGGLYMQEINVAIDAAMRQQKFTIAQCLPDAADKLTELIDTEKGETVRKACLDIIALQKADAPPQIVQQDGQTQNKYNLTQEKAAKIWAVLAEKEPKNKIGENPC